MLSVLHYLSPQRWKHINLTGDYLWRRSVKRSVWTSSGRYGRCNYLSVPCSPFSEMRPSKGASVLEASRLGVALLILLPIPSGRLNKAPGKLSVRHDRGDSGVASIDFDFDQTSMEHALTATSAQ